MSAGLRRRLQVALEDGRAAALETAMADWALRHGGNPTVAVALAACVRAVAEGHSCLALDEVLPALPGEQPWCNREQLEQALAASDLVGAPGASRPLIHDDGRLYLHRYWVYETRLAEDLKALAAARPETVDTAPLAPGGGLFDNPWTGTGGTHWQAVATFVALRHRFAVISGGPGTGKTYTVLRLMRVLVDAALQAGRAPPLIRLAAPTGKAAARMVESIGVGLDAMALPEAIRSHIPTAARTLHRLVGIGRAGTQPRHNRDNTLPADIVIVDEASMIDLPMMAKLTDALPRHARLILLGDRYQLASVESGSVLAELCNAAGFNAFSAAQQAAAGPLLAEPVETADAPLADHVVTLQTSHRFSADSPIGQLAAAVNAGDADDAIAVARAAGDSIRFSADSTAQQIEELVAAATLRFQTLIDANGPDVALPLLSRHGLLCAVRRGPTGSETLNGAITTRLVQRNGLDPRRAWYHGRPVMVTRNDYRSGLYNGDVGVCLADGDGHLRVWFQTGEGLQAWLPSALPDHETVYAMTVHKSQGSEFNHVTLVLPPEDNPALSRELLYTGITRARESVTLLSSEAALRRAVATRIERHSGLSARLV